MPPMGLYSAITSAARVLPPEAAHLWTIRALKALPARRPPEDDPVLATHVFGLDFANPVGLAAGFDKDAEVVRAMAGFGFGFVEVGTITPRPQPGNPKPRVFRLPADKGVINRYGFNSRGLDAAEARLAALNPHPVPVGVNIGKNKDTEDAARDYAEGARRLAPHADYLTINVSSPNTPGLRALQSKGELTKLLEAVRAALPDAAPPVLLKIAPDLTEADLADIAAVASDGAVDGLIVSNTTVWRPDTLKSAHRGETGGLSGVPLFDLSTRVLADMYRATGGAVPLIGVGGVATGADVYAKIRAGASLVQLYTALVYEGPGLVGRIKRELATLLRRDGYEHVADAVGTGGT